MDPNSSTRGDMAATFFHRDSPAQTKISGIILSAVPSGVGQWFITLTQGLALGEYISGGGETVSAAPFEFDLFHGDPTHYFIQTFVGGVPADVNGIFAWLARAFN